MIIVKLVSLSLPLRNLQTNTFRNVLRYRKIYTNFRSTSYDCAFRNENVTQDFMEKLCLAIGKERISTSLAVRNQYGTDEGCHGSSPADIVTYPHSVEDICEIAKLCSIYHVPLIPHGTGTGLEHGIGAIMGGISVDLAVLNSVVDLNIDDFDCTVEAGITRKTLNTYLRETGLMFPILVLMHLLVV